jgi:hypothetical protein
VGDVCRRGLSQNEILGWDVDVDDDAIELRNGTFQIGGRRRLMLAAKTNTSDNNACRMITDERLPRARQISERRSGVWFNSQSRLPL